MLVYDFGEIGNRLFEIRKRAGLTQSQVAEKANLSDRAYADIERGTVNMRVETILRICDALKISPDVLLTKKDTDTLEREKELAKQLERCTMQQRDTALRLLSVYLDSIQ